MPWVLPEGSTDYTPSFVISCMMHDPRRRRALFDVLLRRALSVRADLDCCSQTVRRFCYNVLMPVQCLSSDVLRVQARQGARPPFTAENIIQARTRLIIQRQCVKISHMTQIGRHDLNRAVLPPRRVHAVVTAHQRVIPAIYNSMYI